MPKAIRCVLFFVAVLLAAPAALAQSVRVSGYSRSDNGCGAEAGAAQFDPCSGINYVACANDVSFDFTLTVDDPNMATDHLVVLAGPSDSTCIPAPGNTATPGCWPVVKAGTPLAPTMNVTVRARDIAANVGINSPPTTYIRQTNVATACESQTCPGPVNIGVYFLIEGSNNQVPAAENPGEFLLHVGTLGPQAPGNVGLSVNDGYVTLSWQAPTETAIYGYNVYCQNWGRIANDAALPSDAPASVPDACDDTPGCVNLTEAGGLSNQCPATSITTPYQVPSCSGAANVVDTGTTVVDGGTDSAFTSPTDSGVTTGPITTQAGISLINAIVASPCPPGKTCLCASPTDTVDGAMTAGASTSGATISVQNFEFFTFAVAAVDVLGNVGPVGNLKCGTPGPVKDFWYNYSTLDGGLAGGGYCALEGVGMPAGSACMAVGMGLAAVGLVRRRRRRAKGTKPLSS